MTRINEILNDVKTFMLQFTLTNLVQPIDEFFSMSIFQPTIKSAILLPPTPAGPGEQFCKKQSMVNS